MRIKKLDDPKGLCLLSLRSKKAWIALMMNFLCIMGIAQNAYTWQDFVEDVSDDEYAEEQGWTESMEELALLAAHPLDINTATREELRQLPFLTDEQIEDIHTYVFLHRGMRSLSELMAIPSIDFRSRKFLSLFVRAEAGVFEKKDTLTLKRLLQDSQHEVATRFDIPLYYRMGYSYPPQKGGYEGSAFYNNLRYRLSAKKHLGFGLSAEKDQGEPFRDNGGWDSYGAYLVVRNIGHLQTAVVGDYKMGFGEGVVINSGFSTGKSSLMKHPSQGIRAKQGMDEVNYFRGGATTFKVKNMELSAWISYRQLDATLATDGTVRTILTSGLHRTTAELDKKNNLNSTMTGGNISWRNHGFHIGTTGYYQRFHRELSPGDALYRRIYPKGRNFGIVGMNYGYTHLWFSISGETAYSTERGGWATQNRASWKISPRYTLSGSYRFYSYKYYSFHASALSENSDVQNESGGTLRLDANPIGGLMLTAYADFFYNPWPRYSLTHSSSGQELLVQAEYSIKKRNTLSVRYQLKRKEQSDHMKTHNRLRLQYTRLQGQYWRLQSLLTLHSMDGSGVGWALSERIRFQKSSGLLSAMLSYFDTPDYDTRLFVYEPTLRDTFRFPSFFGRGMRLVTAARYTFWHRRLELEALYSVTRYTDRKTQSSGMQEIRSPWKQDICLQLRLRI